MLPAGFQGLSGPADVWVPAHTMSGPNDLDQRWSHSWNQVARLKPGVTTQQAMSAVALAGARVDQAFVPPRGSGGWGAKARTLDETRIEPAIRKSVLVLLGAVSFVLLIACVNVANLLLARGAAAGNRHPAGSGREAQPAGTATAHREPAAGAHRRRGQPRGGVCGRARARLHQSAGGEPVRQAALRPHVPGPQLDSPGRESPVVHAGNRAPDRFPVWTCAGVAGLRPAADVTDALKSAGARPSGFAGLRVLTGKSVLVVVEVALAVVLLAGAGLMIKSFGRLIATRSGIDPDNVLTVRLNLPLATPGAYVTAFFDQLEKRVAALPGVVSAGLSSCHALGGGCSTTIIWFRDRPPVQWGTEPGIGIHYASTNYFKTMKIPLLRGRWFAEADRRDSPKVVLISETAARRFWPSEDPIGKPIGVGQNGFDNHVEVIGIQGDVRYGQMDEPPKPEAYISFLQSSRPNMILSLRTAGSPTALTQAVEREVHALNKDLPVFDVKTMNERIRDLHRQGALQRHPAHDFRRDCAGAGRCRDLRSDVVPGDAAHA